jgi:hypothetical protein
VLVANKHCLTAIRLTAMATPSIASFFSSSSSSSSPSKGKGEKRPHASIGGNDDDDDDDFETPLSMGGRSVSTSEPGYRWMTADELPTVNHADRFMAMYRTTVAMDMEARFRTLYRAEVEGRTLNPNYQYCYLSALQDADHRKGVGAAIISTIRDRWDFKLKCPRPQFLAAFLQIPVEHTNLRVVWIPVDRAKVAVHWITCVVHRKLPDMTQALWKRFQCSERCTNGACFRLEHLCWESAADNQSRGHTRVACQRVCAHPGCLTNHIICRCNQLHNPVCVSGSRADSLV